jgi:hypothetical protein
MNKILEILEKKQKENKRTGSLWDWNEGYPESQWEILCQLENGHFFEDKKNLIFYTTENEEIGFKEMPKYNQDKKNFITEKTSEKIIYWSTANQITKSLTEEGVFEITDRVGHYIKLRVEPMLNEVSTVKNDYKSIRLNGQELALLYMALSKSLFSRPKKGQIFYESHNDGSCTLHFKRDYYSLLTASILTAFYQGKFRQSNAESDWNDLKDKIDGAKISERNDVENLELYSLYDE